MTATSLRTHDIGTARAGWLVQFGQIFKRWMSNTLRQAWGIGASLVQPIIWILLFGQVFSAVGQLPGFSDSNYITFLVPGILMMTVLYAGAWAGTGYIEDIDRGIMDRLLTTPISRTAILSGQVAQQVAVCALQTLIVIGIGAVGGASYPGGVGGMAVAIVAALILCVIFSSFSNAIALITRNQLGLIGISQIVVLPLTFLSSAMMSPVLQPQWVQTVSKYNPMTWATNTARDALAGTYDWGTILWHGGLLTALAAAAFTWSVRAFRSYQRSL